MKSLLRLFIFFGVIFIISVPSWADIINVCYNTRNGDLRYVADPSDCRPNENPLSLNTEGPAGSDGISCWDLNGNGACDLAEEDKNNEYRVQCVRTVRDQKAHQDRPEALIFQRIYTNYCGGTFDDGLRLVECLCDDDGSKAISGGVSCGQFWYPISSGPYEAPSGTEGWTALCKNLIDDSQFGPDTLSVTCIRP